MNQTPCSKKSVYQELMLAWILVIGLSRLAMSVPVSFVRENSLLMTALLLIYVPFLFNFKKRQPVGYFDSNTKQLIASLVLFLGVALLIFSLATLVVMALPFLEFIPRSLSSLPEVVLTHLLVIALPEEFFFRGYFQTRLNQVYPKRWSFLGGSFGMGLILTSLIFAFSHSMLTLQWWHPLIFFPSLVFGWLREKSDSITASILFHATSNVFSYFVLVRL